MGLKSTFGVFVILTPKSTGSATLSSVFAERFSDEGQADFVINKAFYVSLKDRNNLYISCVLIVLTIFLRKTKKNKLN